MNFIITDFYARISEHKQNGLQYYYHRQRFGCHDAMHAEATAESAFVVRMPIIIYMNVLHVKYA